MDIAILYKKDYHEKLSLLFDNNPNFEKLAKFNLETHLDEYRKILADNLGGCVNSRTMTYLSPNSSTSISYGTLKLHKPEKAFVKFAPVTMQSVQIRKNTLKNLLTP